MTSERRSRFRQAIDQQIARQTRFVTVSLSIEELTSLIGPFEPSEEQPAIPAGLTAVALRLPASVAQTPDRRFDPLDIVAALPDRHRFHVCQALLAHDEQDARRQVWASVVEMTLRMDGHGRTA